MYVARYVRALAARLMSLYSALGECGCKLALKFTASNTGLWPSLYRKPLALRERIFACETVEGLARLFMTFKKYKSYHSKVPNLRR